MGGCSYNIARRVTRNAAIHSTKDPMFALRLFAPRGPLLLKRCAGRQSNRAGIKRHVRSRSIDGGVPEESE